MTTSTHSKTRPQFFSSLKQLLLLFVLVWGTLAMHAQNAITAENALPGNPASEWDINGAGDLSIQGFATEISSNTGAVINFKIDVKAPASPFTIKIYRLGYYAGNGARRVASLGPIAGTQQPEPLYDIPTGKTDCSNWSVSASWNSTGAVSGVYVARLNRSDNGGASHIVFVVRNDASNSQILFKTSDATWQGYNCYGGNSLYVNNSGTAVTGYNHATKVSYNRPFYTRNGGGGGGESEDWVFNAEYPMIRWIERNGYDVSYATDVDMHRDATPVTPSMHKIMMATGHDEYWSAEQRAKFETARNNGVNLAFFDGNEVYWKTRWEDNNKTLVCYKEGTLGENICGFKCDDSNSTWTGSWRDGAPAQYPGSDGGRPENSLTGQISWDGNSTAIQVPDTYRSYRFWRNTSIADLSAGENVTFPDGTLGYEWDYEQYGDYYPPGRVTLSRTVAGSHTHKLSLYRHQSGALVFGAGTVQWSWGLDSSHDRGNEAPSADMQQATVNLFADMGVQPASLQPGLIPAGVSTDASPPVSTISTPLNGSSFAANLPITIAGTASDIGGTVAAVEVSVDGGITWKSAVGTTNWTFSWRPLLQGPATIKTHAVDDSYNIEPTGMAPSVNVADINITEPATPVCPCTIFDASTVPQNIAENDNAALEIGFKFKPNHNGFITGIRFYKGPLNTGTHIGTLWDSSGTALAQTTFFNETASGWQEVSFGSPVAVTAGTTYVASYHSPTGSYSQDTGTFAAPISTYYLTALADGDEGVNGVYSYTSTPAFPTSGYQASNYWVDVVFNNVVGPDITPPVVITVLPADGASSASVASHPIAIFSEAIDPATAIENSMAMSGPDGANIPGTISSAANHLIFTPAALLAYNTTYSVVLKGGYSDPHLTDLAGNRFSGDYSWTFKTSAPPPPPPSEGTGGPILVVSAASNPFSRYTAEILRAEGLNEFAALDITAVDAATLNNYDVVVLGEINVDAEQVAMLTNWVNAGGTLICFKPNALLSPLMGISTASGTLSDKYLLFDTSNGPGAGLVNETIQFHGVADKHNLAAATSLATLYSSADTATNYPAITTNTVGSNGGRAVAFTYDLPRSIVYTRQGNPEYAGQEHDGATDNIRSSDLFFPDYLDFSKIQIPQADEQQRMLVNIILQGNLHRKPLPRFWFLPRKLKAAIVMTGDDHGTGGTAARFNHYLDYGHNSAAEIVNWDAVRGTSYIYVNTPLSDTQAAAFTGQGFEIALHLTTNCGGYTQSSLEQFFNAQLPTFTSKYSSIPAPVTNRTHCISWSDWASKPKAEILNGIRLNTDYYYYPAAWVQNRSGMFTGSGMPMRFADSDGTILDDYQVVTQIPDESGITSYGGFTNTLLDNAIGTKGYYGVFCANMHTDAGTSEGSNAIIASAIARQIPVISSRQMLTWLDARNSASFGTIGWNGNDLTFHVSASSEALNLQGMLPVNSATGQLTGIIENGSPIPFTTEVIKGINYAFFDAHTGNYTATYSIDTTAPVITNIAAVPNTDGTVTITWTTNESTTGTLSYGIASTALTTIVVDGTSAVNHTITVSGLTPGTVYYYGITARDTAFNTATKPESPDTLSFIVPVAPISCVNDRVTANFEAGTLNGTFLSPGNDGEVTLAPKAASAFSGSALPSGWQSFPWTSGGTSAVAGGKVMVDGARLNITGPGDAFTAGSTLEFTATFGEASFQHIGFGGGNDATGSGGIYNGENPWAMFSTGNSTSQLQARTYLGSAGTTNVNIGNPGDYIGTAHVFRIEWLMSGINFYIDNTLACSTPTVITGTMRPAISDYNTGGPGISVDWIRATPYAGSGTYISQITDAGTPKLWGTATWTADIPAGTALQLSQRQASSAAAISSAPWTAIPSIGESIGGTSQFIQYKADLTTSNPSATPVLRDFGITCSNPTNAAPAVTAGPVSQVKCSNESVSFQSAAVGSPSPTVQWQSSPDNGISWSNIQGATAATYTFTATFADNGRQFRAAWTNTEGQASSAAAILTVNAPPVATISAVTNPVCPGGTIALQLTSATGASPYTLIVNGVTYPGVAVGQTFMSAAPSEQSIWGSAGLPANPSVTDNQPIEIGTKFRASAQGFVMGARFYKGATNSGVHTAHLWTTSGILLATATFTSESGSGWQEVHFASPVAIQANTTYIISYLSASGYFAIDSGFFSSTGVSNGALTALQSGIDGPNGVYKYGGGFPDNGNTANYWVDVLFAQTSAPETTYNLTGITDNNGCSNSGAALSSAVITIGIAPAGSITPLASNVCSGSAMNLVFNATAGNGPFTLTVNGNTYSGITSGTPFSAGTAMYSTETASVFSPTATGGSQTVDNAPIALGVKIRSSSAGTISGIRFYKTGTQVLTFTGTLWNSGAPGAPIATVSYTTDNLPGWKVIPFATPVAINANTSYIASYYASAPNYYAYTANGLAVPLSNGPLTAEASCYKQGPGYPDVSSTANYWVDVVFNKIAGTSDFSLTNIMSASGCMASGNPLSATSINVIGTQEIMESQTACDSYLWTGNGQAYTESGVYTYNSVSENGCPILHKLQLTIRNSTSTTTTQSSYGPYTWAANGLTYSTGGTYVYNSVNASGCSDVATLHLTINQPAIAAISGGTSICIGETANLSVFISGGVGPFTVVYSDGTLQQTITNCTNSFSIPVSPAVSTTYTLVSVTDANGVASTSNIGNPIIRVKKLYPFYSDSDSDGYGAGALVDNICAVNATTPPAGYSVNNLDCNDAMSNVNPGHVEVLYNGIDDNCSGQLDEGSQIKTRLLPSVCGTTLASIGSLIGITTVSSAITAYRIRVTSGSTVQIIERTVPHFTLTMLPNYAYAATYSIDIELQRNGIWLGYYGEPCLVSSPSVLAQNGATQLVPTQCGITLTSINTLISTVSLPYVTGYRFRATNLTPGISGANVVQTIDRTLHWFTFQMLAQYNYNTTYRIEVAVKTNGAYSGFGSPCEITTPASGLINCGITVNSSGTLVAAGSLSGATQYRFLLTHTQSGATTTIDRNTNSFTFNMLPGYMPGGQYLVSVSIKTGNMWSPFGPACVITAPGSPSALRHNGEDADPQRGMFDVVALPNPFASAFTLAITPTSTDDLQIRLFDVTGRLIDKVSSTLKEADHLVLGTKLPSGVYLVTITQAGDSKTIRVVKR